MKDALDFWRPTDTELSDTGLGKFNPNMEVTETATSFKLKFDLPGFTKDQIKIDLHNNEIIVSGERLQEKTDLQDETKEHVSEIFYGSFYKTFSFPTEIEAEGVQAKYDNGVLNLTVEKREPRMAKQITVN